MQMVQKMELSFILLLFVLSSTSFATMRTRNNGDYILEVEKKVKQTLEDDAMMQKEDDNKFLSKLHHPGPPKGDIPSYTTYYTTQYLNHFDFSDDRTFQQRYLVSDEHWTQPVLLFYAGNEGPIEQFYNNTGFVFELAQEFQALVIFGEHRYYGKSLPFGTDDTFKQENMKYLTIEQAMADYAYLVDGIKHDKKINKVIVFGGSYGGILAAFLRFKYPNVFDGALAASAPLYQTAGITDPAAFFGKVTQDFAAVDSRCPDVVKGAFTEIYEKAQEGTSGLEYISTNMKLCKTLTIDQLDHLLGWVRTAFTTLAMVDYPYPSSFLGNLPAYPVSVACHTLIDNMDNKMAALAKSVGLVYNATGIDCYDIESEFHNCSDVTGCGTDAASLSWDYQACSEVNLHCISNNITDMFPPTTYDISEYCHNTWGLPLTKRTNWVGLNFWIENMSAASNIIFSNGNLDPWSVGGITKNIGDSIIAILIDGGAHHLDLRSTDSRDPDSVTKAREQEKSIIKGWIEN